MSTAVLEPTQRKTSAPGGDLAKIAEVSLPSIIDPSSLATSEKYWTLAHRILTGDFEFWPRWSNQDACKMIGIASVLTKEQSSVGLETKAAESEDALTTKFSNYTTDVVSGIAGGVLRSGALGADLPEVFSRLTVAVSGLAEKLPGSIESQLAFDIAYNLLTDKEQKLVSPEQVLLRIEQFEKAVEVLKGSEGVIPATWQREILLSLVEDIDLSDPDLSTKLSQFVRLLGSYTSLFASYAEYPSVGRLFQRYLEDPQGPKISLSIDLVNLKGSMPYSDVESWSLGADAKLGETLAKARQFGSAWISKVTEAALGGTSFGDLLKTTDRRAIAHLAKLVVSLQVNGFHDRASHLLAALSTDLREGIIDTLNTANERRGSIFEQAAVEAFRPVSGQDGVAAGVWSRKKNS